MACVACWLQGSLERVFPSSPERETVPLSLTLVRGGRLSLQVGVRNSGREAVRVAVEATAPDGCSACVRRVGWVPMAHHNPGTDREHLDGVGHVPGLVPDPLHPEGLVVLGPLETQAFWITLTAPVGTVAGDGALRVRVAPQGEPVRELVASVRVADVTLRADPPLPVTHWFYADALCDWYGADPFDARFWAIVRPYMRDLVEHGSTCQYVPLLTPPTDGVKRPTQLLRVDDSRPGVWGFDFADVRRWVRMARECGATYFEWTHFFTQWGARAALRVYRDNADADSLLWPPETPATSDTYRSFLGQLLPRLRAFVEEEGILDRSIFHVSDEPGPDDLERYSAARALLREAAPWMRVADAQSHVELAREGATDLPIASIASARAYREAGIPAWAYFCCGPRGPYINRLMDTPLPAIRLTGWLLRRFGAGGFLHWGYNYWYRSQTRQLIDPFAEQSGVAWPDWPYGDPFVVYPGVDGPLDSIRWEVFADSLQDYALLQTLGVGEDAPLLAPLEGYDRFPRDAGWVERARRTLLCAL
ncbi:MAG: DUF4091 domain-containing protein [Chthonomonadales bacterium]|nr:DUF4091 domain-containing protein [Chthonomonadales bacterium]